MKQHLTMMAYCRMAATRCLELLSSINGIKQIPVQLYTISIDQPDRLTKQIISDHIHRRSPKDDTGRRTNICYWIQTRKLLSNKDIMSPTVSALLPDSTFHIVSRNFFSGKTKGIFYTHSAAIAITKSVRTWVCLCVRVRVCLCAGLNTECMYLYMCIFPWRLCVSLNLDLIINRNEKINKYRPN